MLQNHTNFNQLEVIQSGLVLDSMKQEIANEFGIVLGADTSSRDNGRVGGEMTKRLVMIGRKHLNKQNRIH